MKRLLVTTTHELLKWSHCKRLGRTSIYDSRNSSWLRDEVCFYSVCDWRGTLARKVIYSSVYIVLSITAVQSLRVLHAVFKCFSNENSQAVNCLQSKSSLLTFALTDFLDIEREPCRIISFFMLCSTQSCGINMFIDQVILIMSMCLFICNREK